MNINEVVEIRERYVQHSLGKKSGTALNMDVVSKNLALFLSPMVLVRGDVIQGLDG